MMNRIQIQDSFLSELCNIIHNEADDDYEQVELNAELNEEEGWIDLEFTCSINGVENSRAISQNGVLRVNSVLKDLHRTMKENAAGDWKSLTIKIDLNGKANTRFNYET